MTFHRGHFFVVIVISATLLSCERVGPRSAEETVDANYDGVSRVRDADSITLNVPAEAVQNGVEVSFQCAAVQRGAVPPVFSCASAYTLMYDPDRQTWSVTGISVNLGGEVVTFSYPGPDPMEGYLSIWGAHFVYNDNGDVIRNGEVVGYVDIAH